MNLISKLCQLYFIIVIIPNNIVNYRTMKLEIWKVFTSMVYIYFLQWNLLLRSQSVNVRSKNLQNLKYIEYHKEENFHP